MGGGDLMGKPAGFNNWKGAVDRAHSKAGAAQTTATSAQATATQASSDAGTALAAANAASSAAAAAGTLASNAQASANGKNTVFYSATTPSANAANDTWFQTAVQHVPPPSGPLTTVIIGQYKSTAAGTGSWVSQPLTSATFAYIDAGKITTGTLSGVNVIGTFIETQPNVGTGTSPSVVPGVLLNSSGQLFCYDNTGARLIFDPSSGLTITGGIFQTAANGRRVVLGSNLIDRIQMWTGSETTGSASGALAVSGTSTASTVNLSATAPGSGLHVSSIQVSESNTANAGNIGLSSTSNINLTASGPGGVGPGLVQVTGIIQPSSGSNLDLTAVAAADAATDTGLGDKISLYGGTAGFGVQSGELVAYLPGAAVMSVKQHGSAGSQQSSSSVYRPILASAFTVSSLAATKTDVRDLEDGALDKVMALRPVRATSANDTHLPKKHRRQRMFFVAEDVEQVDPGLSDYVVRDMRRQRRVPKEADLELVGNNLAAFPPLFAKAMQEMRAEYQRQIDAQDKRIKQLERQVKP